MSQIIRRSLIVSLFVFIGGCTTESPPATATSDSDADTSALAASADTETAASSEIEASADGTESDPLQAAVPESTPGEMTTVEDFLTAIRAKLQPPNQDVAAAIEVADQGYQKLPGDENMIKLYSSLLYQSLGDESDASVLNQRRMVLGKLARELIAMNKDNLEPLGQMPVVLILEEAKAFIADGKIEDAWKGVTEAREYGFDQTEVLFLDPAYGPLLENEQAVTQLKGWVSDEVAAQLAQQESFPFDFTLMSRDGSEVSLADFAGKIVIVDFWGTWCPPCRETIPHLVELAEERKDTVAVVGINIENPGSPVDAPLEEVQAKLDEFEQQFVKLNYPCLAGKREIVELVPGFEGFPTMVVIDAKGKVRMTLSGYKPKAILDATVDALLKAS